MVSVFKRQAKIGGVLIAETGGDLKELVESYILLITMTGFLEVSRNSPNNDRPINACVPVRGEVYG